MDEIEELKQVLRGLHKNPVELWPEDYGTTKGSNPSCVVRRRASKEVLARIKWNHLKARWDIFVNGKIVASRGPMKLREAYLRALEDVLLNPILEEAPDHEL
jgi:hypothetical protein